MYQYQPQEPLTVSDTADGSITKLPNRDEIATQDKWQLTELYTSVDAFRSDITNFKSLLTDITAFKGTLAKSKNLIACLNLRDKISIKAGRLFAYARLSRDTDATNSNYQQMTAQIESLLAESAGASAFIESEILALPEVDLHKKIAKHPELKEYKFYLEDLIRQKKHILSPKEEELLAKASDIFHAPNNIYTILTNADLTFPETLTDSGEKVTLSEGRYNKLIRSQNRTVRKDAFENLFNTYYKFRNTFATALNSSIKSTLFITNVKKYKSVLAAALSDSNIPESVYLSTLDATHRKLSYLHEYVNLKKQQLNLDEIHMYDLYVPVVKAPETDYPYLTGLKLVKESLSPLGNQYITDLTNGVNSNWLDIYENRGKHTGAYSWGIYGVHPFVLLNYDNRYGSVSTLAHELGHAMHSYYSQQTQSYINASYTIFCAEVASTTNEILLLDHMLKIETDPQKRIYFINQYLEQVRTTVYRQALFAEFELITHQEAEAGNIPTTDRFEQLWLELNRKYYGNEIILDDAIKIEWARIPHFYRPFYVYQYVTGYAAATTLAANLQTKDSYQQNRYLDYLKSGGSDYSITLLKNAGADMTTPAPLELTLEKFKTRLDELKQLLGN